MALVTGPGREADEPRSHKPQANDSGTETQTGDHEAEDRIAAVPRIRRNTTVITSLALLAALILLTPITATLLMDATGYEQLRLSDPGRLTGIGTTVLRAIADLGSWAAMGAL